MDINDFKMSKGEDGCIDIQYKEFYILSIEPDGGFYRPQYIPLDMPGLKLDENGSIIENRRRDEDN
jgi:hypothetical protein